MCPGLYQHINRRSVPALRDGLQFKMTGHCSNMILCHIAHETSFILCSVMHRWTTWCSSLLPTFTGPTGSVSSALQNGANLQTLSEEPSCPENKVASCRLVGKKRELPVLLLCDTSQTPGRTNCSGNTNIKGIRKCLSPHPKHQETLLFMDSTVLDSCLNLIIQVISNPDDSMRWSEY